MAKQRLKAAASFSPLIGGAGLKPDPSLLGRIEGRLNGDRQSSLVEFFPIGLKNWKSRPRQVPSHGSPLAASQQSQLRKSAKPVIPNKKDQTTGNKPKKRKLQQLYLDLGQRNFGKQIVCNVCGMLFVHGVHEDLRQHEQICSNYKLGVAIQITENARIVGRGEKDAVIVEVRATDKNCLLRKKVQQVREVVDQELGFVPASLGVKPFLTTYLYIRGNRVVGMVIAESISQAFVTDDSSFVCLQKPKKAVIGIYQMWVHSNVRHQGIASRLIDTVRENFVFGVTVPAKEVAFSSPTEAGARFAKHYAKKSGGETVALVYDCR